MSQIESPNSQGLAWLSHSGQTQGLRVGSWSSEPATFSFYAPDFARLRAEPWLCGSREVLSLQSQPLPTLAGRKEPSGADFSNLHEVILKDIEQGVFEKVVPIVSTELQFSRPLSANMLANALQPHSHQFSYGFEFAGEGLCGITPELLFSVRQGKLKTMALAGTGRAEGPSLLDDAKECLEHRLVVDHIRSELGDLGPVEIGDTVERVYGPLKHLLTPIAMTVSRSINFIDLVDRLHPTAALGGWPRKPAATWLQSQPFHRTRSRFGAPFGYWDREAEEMLCVVAIRCLQWNQAHAQISTGCGVVLGSVASREWKELQLKREAICRLLGLSL